MEEALRAVAMAYPIVPEAPVRRQTLVSTAAGDGVDMAAQRFVSFSTK